MVIVIYSESCITLIAVSARFKPLSCLSLVLKTLHITLRQAVGWLNVRSHGRSAVVSLHASAV